MLYFRRLLLPILVFVFCHHTFGQINKELKHELRKVLNDKEKKLLDKADKYYNNQDYLYALSIYDSLYKKRGDNLYLAYLLGTVQSYDPYYFENSEILIKLAAPLREKLFDYDFYLGKALENNEKFEEAIKQYELYLKSPIPDTLKTIVNHQIAICKTAQEQLKKGAIANITALGAPLNTEGSEYSPVLPTNEKFIAYTYRGPRSKGGKQKIPNKPDDKGTYFEDIFISYKNEKGGWEPPTPIDAINSNGHDGVMCISHDGQKLYLYRNEGLGNGDIYVTRLKGTTWSRPEKMLGINSNFWEGSACFTPDEKYLYFSSERPGGAGGRDIWVAERMKDGNYGKPQPASDAVNTPYDEDAPFITADGKTLFFSSTGHNSTGGYDIFRSDMKNGKWTKPYNIGKPVNTNQDDKYYWVSADGERGYYSSERKGGLGGQDIYLVEPGMFGRPTALIMLNGVVYVNDKPAEVEIHIKSKLMKKDFVGAFNSNSSTGEYLVNLPAGNDFEVIFKAKGVTVSKHISTVGIDSFAPLRTDANLYTPAYLTALKAKEDSVQAILDDLARLSMTYDEFLEKYGSVSEDSLIFKVQIGAFRMVENFSYRKLLTLPPVRRQIFEDGITRFTMGDLKTIKEAEDLRKKSVKAGFKDAFVIVVYKEERISLYSFVKGTYKK